MPGRPQPLRIAIDTGGTFTDCVWVDQGRLRMLKVFSTPADPSQATVEALRKLERRYQLAVMSNVDDDLFAATAARLGVRFEPVVTAQEAGCYKPCMRMFRLAEDRIGVGREHWLHVGQSIYHDVIPAQSLGLRTVWVNRPSPRPGSGAAKAASAKPDLEVPDLETLADLAKEN